LQQADGTAGRPRALSGGKRSIGIAPIGLPQGHFVSWETLQIVIVLVLTTAVFVAFVAERWPPDVVAMAAFAVLLATGILNTKDALGVFSNGGPIAVGAMFVLSAAIERAGWIERLGSSVTAMAATSPTVALVGLAVCVMCLSAFMNNTPVVVLLTPVAIMLARALDIAPSRLLIPLSFAAIMGGTTTLIGTSTNLLVSDVATQNGLAPISMFEITIPGVLMGLIGIAYMALFGRWLLPDREPTGIDLPARRFVTEMLVPEGSPFVGKSLKDAHLTEESGIVVLDVIRQGRSQQFGLSPIEIEAGDRLVVRSKVADVMGLRESNALIFGAPEEHRVEPIESQATVVMEGVVGPQSRLIGYRIAELNFRRLYGVYILAIYRQGTALRSNFEDISLESGDTLLLEGPAEGLRRLFERRILVNLTSPTELPFRRRKGPIAALAIVSVMVLAAFGVLPVEALALIAAAAVVVTGCLTADEAYEAIQWRVLMLIFGMLGLGLAMEKTGAAALIVNQLAALLASLGPFMVLSMIYLFTSILTEIVSNNAAAILITPIAIGLAQELGADPRPFVMAVLFAASASFATPVGYQTNTFVYGVGGYRFSDFLRIGVPLNVIFWLVATVLIPWYWPLQPR
jgi:di/tricarboxylate transporter